MSEYEMIEFVKWYSGMSEDKIKKAYKRFKIEQKENEKSECCTSNIYFTSTQIFCSKCDKCLGHID